MPAANREAEEERASTNSTGSLDLWEVDDPPTTAPFIPNPPTSPVDKNNNRRAENLQDSWKDEHEDDDEEAVRSIYGDDDSGGVRKRSSRRGSSGRSLSSGGGSAEFPETTGSGRISTTHHKGQDDSTSFKIKVGLDNLSASTKDKLDILDELNKSISRRGDGDYVMRQDSDATFNGHRLANLTVEDKDGTYEVKKLEKFLTEDAYSILFTGESISHIYESG